MSIQIELSPTIEARLRDTAQANGQDVAEYAQGVLERDLLQQALFTLKERQAPQSLQDLAAELPSPPGQNWLAGLVGEWPGEESDAELEVLLRELS